MRECRHSLALGYHVVHQEYNHLFQGILCGLVFLENIFVNLGDAIIANTFHVCSMSMRVTLALLALACHVDHAEEYYIPLLYGKSSHQKAPVCQQLPCGTLPISWSTTLGVAMQQFGYHSAAMQQISYYTGLSCATTPMCMWHSSPCNN